MSNQEIDLEAARKRARQMLYGKPQNKPTLKKGYFRDYTPPAKRTMEDQFTQLLNTYKLSETIIERCRMEFRIGRSQVRKRVKQKVVKKEHFRVEQARKIARQILAKEPYEI